MSYFINVLTLVAIFTVLGVSLNWLLGYGGMFSIAHGAFFGFGAYTFAILVMRHGWPIFPAFVAAAVVSGVIGGFLGATAIRISGEFLIIASFGVQEIASSVLTNWNSVTGGVNGIVLPGTFGFFGMSPNVGALIVTAVFAVVALGISWRIARSRRGRVGNWLRAMRSDEIAYVGSGRSSALLKIVSHVVSFAGTGLVGAIYADYLRFVAPNDFNLNTSVLVLTIVAIGGAGNWLGPFIGSIVAVGLPQILTFTPLPASEATPIQEIFYGVILVLFMLFRPNGLLNRDYRAVPVSAFERERGLGAGQRPREASEVVATDSALSGWARWRHDVSRTAQELGHWMSTGR